MLASAGLAACANGAANPPPFNTGTTAPPAIVSAAPSSVAFSGIGSSYQQTLTVTVNTGVSTVTVSAPTCGSGPTAIVTFAAPSGSGTTFTDVVTPVNPGSCSATISSTAGGSATVTFTVNSGTVTVSNVSPNAASIEITVLNVNGSPPTAAQVPPAVNPTVVALSTAGGGNCTTSASGETCTVALPAPTGSVSYRFRVKDAAARVLSQATASLTIASGVANPSSVQLHGVVASVSTTLPVLTPGTSFSGPITVQAFDASGAQIVGSATFANPFTLTDNDASTHTSLTLNASTGKTVGPVSSPNDVVILNYDGAVILPFTVTATIPPAP